MATYLLTLPTDKCGVTRVDGVNTMIITAANSDDAKAKADAYSSSDPVGFWTANATVSDVTSPSQNLNGYAFNVRVLDGETEVVDVTYTGTASNETLDEIAAQLVILLNATTPIAGAAYNSSTNVLKVAETTDNLGDHIVLFTVTAADGSNVTGLHSTITDEGAADAALTVQLAGDSVNGPVVVAAGSRV